MHEVAEIAIVVFAAGFVAVLALAAVVGWKLTRTVRRWRQRFEQVMASVGFGPTVRPIEARVVADRRPGRAGGTDGPLTRR